jgi:hypothetical protein
VMPFGTASIGFYQRTNATGGIATDRSLVTGIAELLHGSVREPFSYHTLGCH